MEQRRIEYKMCYKVRLYSILFIALHSFHLSFHSLFHYGNSNKSEHFIYAILCFLYSHFTLFLLLKYSLSEECFQICNPST